jgi:hypothetical protein
MPAKNAPLGAQHSFLNVEHNRKKISCDVNNAVDQLMVWWNGWSGRIDW